MPRKTYLFYANSGDDAKDVSRLIKPNGNESLHYLLEQHFDSTPEGKIPEMGYRLSERNAEGTHIRPGPWVVESVDSYLPDLPVGSGFAEVVICECGYAPLPEDENPWTEIARSNQVTFDDSFGGNEELFLKFLQSDEAAQYELRGRIPVKFKEEIEKSGIAVG
ncbi:hypothetical protein QGP82_14530 [Leptothoe sp. LEGE 181152]|nr:hypothetical protein [Leptothoe sp. LEGE 181152]